MTTNKDWCIDARVVVVNARMHVSSHFHIWTPFSNFPYSWGKYELSIPLSPHVAPMPKPVRIILGRNTSSSLSIINEVKIHILLCKRSWQNVCLSFWKPLNNSATWNFNMVELLPLKGLPCKNCKINTRSKRLEIHFWA